MSDLLCNLMYIFGFVLIIPFLAKIKEVMFGHLSLKKYFENKGVIYLALLGLAMYFVASCVVKSNIDLMINKYLY